MYKDLMCTSFRIFVCCFVTMVLVSKLSFAQGIDRSVYSSGGKPAQNFDLSIGCNIGEPVIFTGAGANVISSQGFEQPDQAVITFSASPGTLMNISAFPNPVRDRLYVNINSDIVLTDLKLEIVDIYGKTINFEYEYSTSLLNHDFRLNLASCSAGVYFIKVSSRKNQYNNTFKFVKE